jgi:hypothetical protein
MGEATERAEEQLGETLAHEARHAAARCPVPVEDLVRVRVRVWVWARARVGVRVG